MYSAKQHAHNLPGDCKGVNQTYVSIYPNTTHSIDMKDLMKDAQRAKRVKSVQSEADSTSEGKREAFRGM